MPNRDSVTLKVFSFTDQVCLSEDETICAKDFQFYPVYEQYELPTGVDGFVGMAPIQTKKSLKEEGPSLIKELANQGSIDRGVVGLFVSRFDNKPHSIQIGDYDTSLIQGGENSLRWFKLSLGDEGDAWRWETDLTKSHFGQHVLFKHDMRWV